MATSLKNLVETLKSIAPLFVFETVIYDETGKHVIATADILKHYESLIKSQIGTSGYLYLRDQIEQLRQILHIKPIELAINQAEIANTVEEYLSNQQIGIPEIRNIYSYYDISLQSPVIVVDVFHPLDVTYEIIYYPKDNPQSVYSIVSADSPILITHNLIPAKEYQIRIRARRGYSLSEYVIAEVTAQRDNIPPAKPVIKSTTPTYLGTTVSFKEPQDADFSHFEVSFEFDGTQYSFTSKSTVLYIFVGKHYENIPAVARQFDTSGNASEPVEFYISSLPFSQAEEKFYNLVTSALEFKIIDATVSYVDSSDARLIKLSSENNLYIPAETDVVYDPQENTVYSITEVQDGGLVKLDRAFGGSEGTNVKIVPSIYSPMFYEEISRDKAERTFQKTNLHYLTLDDFQLSGNTLTQNVDFSSDQYKVDTGYIAVFYNDATGARFATRVSQVQSSSSLLLENTPPFTPTRVAISTPSQFVGSEFAQSYDKIISTVYGLDLIPMFETNVVSSNPDAKTITLENYPVGVSAGDYVLLEANNMRWMYTIESISGNTITLNDSSLLQYFSSQRQKFFSKDSTNQSILAQTQDQISTLVKGRTAESQIVQEEDKIRLSVTWHSEDGKTATTQFIIENGKIIANTETFKVSGDQIITGTIDASKVQINAGNTVIDGTGITLKDGDILLGRFDNNGVEDYAIALYRTGAGQLAKGQIRWDQDGNLIIQPAGQSTVEIDQNNFILKSGTTNARFVLDENGRFVFDGNIVIRNGEISFEQLSSDVQAMLVGDVVIVATSGFGLSQLNPQTTLRQIVYVNGVVDNANDTNGNPSNKYTYQWYIGDSEAQMRPIEGANGPELTISISDIPEQSVVVMCNVEKA